MRMRSMPDTRVHDAQDAHAAGGSHGNGAPHESPWVMVIPLMILALLSFVGGWIGVPHSLKGSDRFDAFLSPVFHATATAAEGAEHRRILHRFGLHFPSLSRSHCSDS